MGNDDDLGGSYRPFSEKVTKFQTRGFVYNKVYWPEAATLSRGGAVERSEARRPRVAREKAVGGF